MKEYELLLAPHLPRSANVPESVPYFANATLAQCALVVTLGLALALKGWLNTDSVAYLLAGSIPITWGPSWYLYLRRQFQHNTTRVVVIKEGTVKEHIRFIELRGQQLVPAEDMVEFLERGMLHGRYGRDWWRGYHFKSGRRCNDEYHADIVRALVDAGLGTVGLGKVGFQLNPNLTLEEAKWRISS